LIYLICSLMRSGSSLLCDLLTRTRLAATPTEWGNHWVLEQFGIDEPGCFPLTAKYVREMVVKYSQSGVWGMKYPSHTYRDQIARFQVESYFPEKPRYIYLKRENHIQQAISAAKAGETGKWYADQKFETGRPNKVTPQYARWKIDYFIRQFEQDEALWETYFRKLKIDPLRLTYEELTADRQATIVKVLEFLDVSVPTDFVLPETVMVKQADRVNAHWEELYKQGS
jgi:trehalose 2-sulfotransferase